MRETRSHIVTSLPVDGSHCSYEMMPNVKVNSEAYMGIRRCWGATNWTTSNKSVWLFSRTKTENFCFICCQLIFFPFVAYGVNCRCRMLRTNANCIKPLHIVPFHAFLCFSNHFIFVLSFLSTVSSCRFLLIRVPVTNIRLLGAFFSSVTRRHSLKMFIEPYHERQILRWYITPRRKEIFIIHFQA